MNYILYTTLDVSIPMNFVMNEGGKWYYFCVQTYRLTAEIGCVGGEGSGRG